MTFIPIEQTQRYLKKKAVAIAKGFTKQCECCHGYKPLVEDALCFACHTHFMLDREPKVITVTTYE